MLLVSLSFCCFGCFNDSSDNGGKVYFTGEPIFSPAELNSLIASGELFNPPFSQLCVINIIDFNSLMLSQTDLTEDTFSTIISFSIEERKENYLGNSELIAYIKTNTSSYNIRVPSVKLIWIKNQYELDDFLLEIGDTGNFEFVVQRMVIHIMSR